MNKTKAARVLEKVLRSLSRFVEFIFAFLEQHMTKIVSFSIMSLCCYNVNALHLIIVIVVVLSIPCGITLLNQTFRIIAIYVSLLLLTKMLYQTSFFPKMESTESNCTNTSVIKQFKDVFTILYLDINWLGYDTLKDGESIGRMLRSYLLVLLIMTFQTVLYVRQKITRMDSGKSPNIPPVLFPKIARQHADNDVKSCIKFFFNYGFYKFGVEVSLTMCAFVVAFRMDLMSVIYSLWLAILVPMSRQRVSRVWPFFIIFLTFSLIGQYAMALGLPPKLCLEYPWAEHDKLKNWLFFASYKHPPNAEKILADFVLFVLLSRQRVVFEIERKFHDYYAGGSNRPVYMEFYEASFINPTPDHTLYTRTNLDLFKKFFLASFYWITLTVVFWTGVNNVNILSLGYLAGAFVFLWLGYDLYLWHIQKILKWWNILLGYSVFVILFKSLHELMGCVYYEFFTENACWFVQLLNFGCSSTVVAPTPSSTCRANVNTDLYSDMACFALILFERRYFHSYYFLHQLDDLQASVGLQAKGAALIESLRQEKEQEQEARERKTLAKIKKNMSRIKAWQKKMHGLKYYEPTDHATAIRLGDYVMFEDPEELRSRLYESSSSGSDDDDKKDKSKKDDKKLTMTEFIKKEVLKKEITTKSSKTKPKKPGVSFHESTYGSRKRIRDVKTQTASKRAGSYGSSVEVTERGGTLSSLQDDSIQMEKLLEGRAKKVWDFFSNFFESLAVSIILFFNKYSSDYRFVEQAMNEERKKTKIFREKTRSFLFSSSGKLISSSPVGVQTHNEDDPPENISESDNYLGFGDRTKSLWIELLISMFYFIMSNTELLCYIAVIIHQIISPTILSLPLPLLIFLWGSLTAVRPTTTFWIILIGYTETTVLIKALFQNWFFPWNSVDAVTGLRSYHPPVLLGIHRDNKYAVADLMLLLMLFLHRYKLKTLGLWKGAGEEDYSNPQNLRIYREVETDDKSQDPDSRYGSLSRNSVILSESTDSSFFNAHIARWKYASRVMAKIDHRGNIQGLCIKEMPGHVLVTHEGRFLMPTDASLSHISRETLANNVVLRVYSSGEFDDARNLYCKMSILQHFTSVRKFFVQITNRVRRVSSDFYTLMFFFDFLTFLIILAGYPSFTQSQASKEADHFYIAENQVPLDYLFSLLLHFLVIITDRVLYLRRNIIGKLTFHILCVLIVHSWMFLILPKITQVSFNSLTLAPIYYVLKCLYFLMSAYQIRMGYPIRVQGHFLCKNYNYINYYCYKGLQFVPFFNQLRYIIDYVCIPSSFTFMEWIKMESVYQIVFECKCSRRAEVEYPAPRGEECPKATRYVPGIFALLGIILVMWSPFFVFAIFDTVSQSNLPKSGKIEVNFGSLGKIFTSTSNFENVIPFTKAQFAALQQVYKDDNIIYAFLSRFSYDDVAVLKFDYHPLEPWIILPEAEERLKSVINNRTLDITVSVLWKIERRDTSRMLPNPTGSRVRIIKGPPPNDTVDVRQNLINVINGSNNPVVIVEMLPKFIEIKNDGEAKPIPRFFGVNSTGEFRDMSLQLKTDVNSQFLRYWQVKEIYHEAQDKSKLSQIPYYETNTITIYTFNEKNIPKIFQHFLTRGIIGIYISFVIVMWTLIKRVMVKYPYIEYEDMPNVDPVLQLCNDIYLARENLEFALEEDLYAKLLFLFRSPETRIKWTRLSVDQRRIEIDSDLY